YPKDFVASRLSFGLSFHYGTYLDDGDDRRLRAYLTDHYLRIASLGAPIRLIVPLTPKVLAAEPFESYLQQFRESAISEGIERFWFDLVELQGEYCKRKYPAAFSPQERRRIVELMQKYGGRGQIDIVEDDIGKLTGPLYLKGLPCYISTHVIEVTPSGAVRQCLAWPQDVSAKLTDPEPRVHFTDGPITCPYEKCLCKTAGIRNCLRPLGVPLREYFREIEDDIARHGRDYGTFFRLLSGQYHDVSLKAR
ncbi:unnamed protein product, partial [marine sediment metagenome]